jgi:surface antigen
MRGVVLLPLVALALGGGPGAAPPLGPTVPGGPAYIGYPYAPRCPAAGRAHVVDIRGMYACNCTSFVAWALSVNGQRTDWFVPGAMDARNWPHVAALAGLRVGRRAHVGDVAVWPSLAPPFGHVAYVIGVRPSGRFDVAEYNYAPPPFHGRYRFDLRDGLAPVGVSFISVPRA